MNKEQLSPLEALEKIGNIDVAYNRNGIESCYSIKDTDEFEIIETALKENKERIEELEETNHLMFIREHKNNKQLKALEIIKEKRVNLEYLKCCNTYEQYCSICSYANEITKEQFDLLKEVCYESNFN